jgi:two-component SAPR family response regulator
MSNKQQTAVEWLSNRAYELFEEYSEGKIDRITLNKLMVEATQQAKEMEKVQIIDACWAGGDDGEQYYEQTYGGNK